MKLIGRQKKIIALGLVILLFLFQVVPTNSEGFWKQFIKAEAATSPEDTSSIVASGSAIAVDPAMLMSAIIVESQTTSSITVRWDAVANATDYYIYKYDDIAEQYAFVTSTKDTSYQFTDLPAGEECYITICASNEVLGYRSEFSVPVKTYTRPDKLQTFTFASNTATSITLKWEDVSSATGYLIYRAGANGDFSFVGSTTEKQYVDTGLTSAKTYLYKIVTYSCVTENTGEESETLTTSTLPSSPNVKIKGGTERIRLSWDAVTRASGYTVYIYQETQYVPLIVLTGKSSTKYIHTSLTNGETYQYYVTAYRTYNGVNYESAGSKYVQAAPVQVSDTNTDAKLYKTKKDFKNSDAYKKCRDFKKKMSYEKSVAIPGMINTNVAEFGCTSMIPQGITYAKTYFFITAYDQKGEENSVVYVVKKSNKKLMTTIVLPNKSHAGGIAFDGKNLWITQAKTLRSIKYSKISSAIKKKERYYELSDYDTVQNLTHQAATVTYYKGLLWVSSYDELKAGYLGSYKIEKKSSTPALTLCNKIKMPTRVQGIEFTSNGRLIVSRSCQTDSSKRGFLHQLDVYKPNLKNASSGKITLGKVRNSIEMPTMNEEITVSGKYLYVNYESAAFGSAVNPMDRICAFPVSYVTKLKKAL